MSKAKFVKIFVTRNKKDFNKAEFLFRKNGIAFEALYEFIFDPENEWGEVEGAVLRISPKDAIKANHLLINAGLKEQIDRDKLEFKWVRKLLSVIEKIPFLKNLPRFWKLSLGMALIAAIPFLLIILKTTSIESNISKNNSYKNQNIGNSIFREYCINEISIKDSICYIISEPNKCPAFLKLYAYENFTIKNVFEKTVTGMLTINQAENTVVFSNVNYAPSVFNDTFYVHFNENSKRIVLRSTQVKIVLFEKENSDFWNFDQ